MTMTSRSERTKLANRMSVSLGNIPALLYPSSSAWLSRPPRGHGARAHMTTKFCVVLLAGLLFAAFSLFLAEYTLTGPRSGSVSAHGSRKAITAQSLLGAGARIVPDETPLDAGGAVTKQEASRMQDAFNLQHYLPQSGRDDSSQADGADTIIDDDGGDDDGGGDGDGDGDVDGGFGGGDGDVNDGDDDDGSGAAGAIDNDSGLAQGVQDEDRQGIDTERADDNVLPVVTNQDAQAANDGASDAGAASHDGLAAQAPKQATLAEDAGLHVPEGTSSDESAHSRDNTDLIAEDTTGDTVGNGNEGAEADAAKVGAGVDAGDETAGASALGDEAAAGWEDPGAEDGETTQAMARADGDAQGALAHPEQAAAAVDDAVHEAMDPAVLGAGDEDLAREGDESLAVDNATEGAVGGRNGAAAAAHAAHSTAVEGDDVAEAERAAQDVAREGDEALHPAEPLHVDADEAARDEAQPQADAGADGVARTGDEASIVEKAAQDASNGSEVVDEAAAKSVEQEAEEQRREEEKLVAPDEAAAADPAQSEGGVADAGGVAASGTSPESVDTASHDAAHPARSAVQVDAPAAQADGVAAEQGGERAATSAQEAVPAVQESAPVEVSHSGALDTVRIEAGDREDNEEAALAIAIAEHSVTAPLAEQVAQNRSDAATISGEAASDQTTQADREDHDALVAEEAAEHVHVADVAAGVAASDEPTAGRADDPPGASDTAQDELAAGQAESSTSGSAAHRDPAVREGGGNDAAGTPDASGSISVPPSVPVEAVTTPALAHTSVATERESAAAILTDEAAAVDGALQEGMITDARAEAHARLNARPVSVPEQARTSENVVADEAADQSAGALASAGLPSEDNEQGQEEAAAVSAKADAHQDSAAVDVQSADGDMISDVGGATHEEDGGDAA